MEGERLVIYDGTSAYRAEVYWYAGMFRGVLYKCTPEGLEELMYPGQTVEHFDRFSAALPLLRAIEHLTKRG